MSKQRIFLTLEQRIEVIRKHEKGISARKLAELFECGRTQINKIIKEKDEILQEFENFKSRGVKRLKTEKFGDINEIVFEWFLNARAKKIWVSGPLLKEKAKQIAEAMGIDNFSASNGWLYRFRMRNNITVRSLCEVVEVDENLCEDWHERLQLLLAGYEDKDIFSLDETALYFRALPSKSMSEKAQDVKGEKMLKERLTIAFCVSATGEKEKPLVIWKTKNQKCFKAEDLNRLEVSWNSNGKAWMTSLIFEEWLQDFDKKMKNQGRNVILLLDNASCHACDADLTNVKLLFLPASTTSKLQPLNHGVIKCLKYEYRQYALLFVIARLHECASASELAKNISVADAIEWIQSAWTNLSQDLIKQCFISCGISNEQIKGKQDLFDASRKEEALAELSKLAGIRDFDPAFIEQESETECYDDFSSEWEQRLMHRKPEEGSDSDEEPLATVDDTPRLSAQETLEKIEYIIAYSESASDKEIGNLLGELKNKLEKNIISDKLNSAKQTKNVSS